jgi:hypothetical protein
MSATMVRFWILLLVTILPLLACTESQQPQADRASVKSPLPPARPAAAEPAPPLTAVVTDENNRPIRISGLKTYYEDDCSQPFMVYIGVPTSTHFEWDFIPLHTDALTIDVPLVIIKTIGVEEHHPGVCSRLAITLADGTRIEGFTAASFAGRSSLGEVKVKRGSFRAVAISEHEPRTEYVATGIGKNSAVLSLLDGSTLALGSARFVAGTWNLNLCFSGYEYPSYMKFYSGGAYYTLGWQDIREVAPLMKRRFRDRFKDLSVAWLLDIEQLLIGRSARALGSFKLTGRSGLQATGSSDDVSGVEGVTQVGQFRLMVTVDFFSDYSKISLQ